MKMNYRSLEAFSTSTTVKHVNAFGSKEKMFRGHTRTAKSQLGTEIQGIDFADHTGQLKLGDKAFLT